MGFDFPRLPALVRQYGEPGRSAAGHFCNRAARQERSQADAQTHPRRTKAGRLRKAPRGGARGRAIALAMQLLCRRTEPLPHRHTPAAMRFLIDKVLRHCPGRNVVTTQLFKPVFI